MCLYIIQKVRLMGASETSINAQANVSLNNMNGENASKDLKNSKDQKQSSIETISAQTQENVDRQEKALKKMKLWRVLFFFSTILLIIVSVLCLVLFLNKPQLSYQQSNLRQLAGNHPGSCNGMLYTLNLSLSKGFLLLNITDVPQCFLDANPTFPEANNRLLASGGWQWIWSQVLKAFIQVWVQNAVNGDDNKNKGCFPPDTIVISKSKGLIKMKDLKVNDQILTKDGYSHVIGWLHKDQNLMLDYLQIGDKNGSFFVSSMHNLATKTGKYAFAKHFDQIIRKEKIQGAYSPMTEAGNFYIAKSNGDKVLAHAFSFVEDPEKYESLARLIFAYFPSGEKTHPLCEWVLKREWALSWLEILGFNWQ